jgi:hypothetical protein
MKSNYRVIIVIQFALYLLSSPLFGKGDKQPMKFLTSNHICTKVIQDFCQEHSFFKAIILKNSKGLIGGYRLQPSIMDSPIPYLDCNGTIIATFHIFGSDDEKKNALKIIDQQRKEFPIEVPLECNNQSAALKKK